MGARDTNAVGIAPRKQPEHLAALDGRNPAPAGLGEFDVVGHDGGRIDDRVGVRQIGGIVADGDPDSHRAFLVDGVARVVIRTADFIALCMQDLYDREHPGTADSNEMKLAAGMEKIF